jgi:hypothetical protein
LVRWWFEGLKHKGREVIAALKICCSWILEACVPVSIRTVANGDEARNKDSGSGSKCNQCEVHGRSPLARATGQAGIAALY